MTGTNAPTDDQSDDRTDAPSLTDPENLRDDEAVPFSEETNVHDDRDHCGIDIEGRAVVGVTDSDGRVLLTIHDEHGVAMLPHRPVESGDDWAAVGREAVELVTDVPFEIDGVEAVREIDHVTEADDVPHTTTRNVVFRASFVGDGPPAEDPSTEANDHWDAAWFAEVPENLPVGADLVADDVRLFLD